MGSVITGPKTSVWESLVQADIEGQLPSLICIKSVFYNKDMSLDFHNNIIKLLQIEIALSLRPSYTHRVARTVLGT